MPAQEPVITDSVKMYIHDIARFPLLSAQKEQRLAQLMELRRALLGNAESARLIAESPNTLSPIRTALDYHTHGSTNFRQQLGMLIKRAWEQFINANLRLVVDFAGRYVARSGGIPLADLISAGNEGLMEAVKRFDWRMHNTDGSSLRFSTYAVWWITQRMKRLSSRTRRTVNLPAHIQDAIVEIQRAMRSLQQEQGTLDLQPGEIAARVNSNRVEKDPYAELITAKWVNEMRQHDQPIASIYEPVIGEDGETVLADIIPDHSALTEHEVANASARDAIEALMMAKLDDRKRTIVCLRFGWYGMGAMSLDDVARQFGITRERVRQIEEDALHILQRGSSLAMLEDYRPQ